MIIKGRRVSYEATVVVPVLNQRRSWLRQCIVSACTQTAPVETIVVTSPRTRASTIQELRELSRKYGNVRVLPEERKGFAAALNTGIRAATAARVGFLLSDDWLDPDAVEQCLGHDADIVSTGLRGRAADGVRILEQVSRTTSLEQFGRLPSLERKASYLQHFFLFEKSVLQAERRLIANGLQNRPRQETSRRLVSCAAFSTMKSDRAASVQRDSGRRRPPSGVLATRDPILCSTLSPT